LTALNTAFFVGEFQPWADMSDELGGQITRASYDAYAKFGWAAAAWSYKLVSNNGGQGNGNWGMVTNAVAAKVPAVDFSKATLTEIESLFKQFGSVPYEPHQGIMKWMNSAPPPQPFKRR
jgi:glucan 1,3-beta-glucosidase